MPVLGQAAPAQRRVPPQTGRRLFSPSAVRKGAIPYPREALANLQSSRLQARPDGHPDASDVDGDTLRFAIPTAPRNRPPGSQRGVVAPAYSEAPTTAGAMLILRGAHDSRSSPATRSSSKKNWLAPYVDAIIDDKPSTQAEIHEAGKKVATLAYAYNKSLRAGVSTGLHLRLLNHLRHHLVAIL